MARNLSINAHFRSRAGKHVPRFRFDGGREFGRWQSELLPAVRATLGRMPEKVPLNPEVQAEWREDGLIKQRVDLRRRGRACPPSRTSSARRRATGTAARDPRLSRARAVRQGAGDGQPLHRRELADEIDSAQLRLRPADGAGGVRGDRDRLARLRRARRPPQAATTTTSTCERRARSATCATCTTSAPAILGMTMLGHGRARRHVRARLPLPAGRSSTPIASA